MSDRSKSTPRTRMRIILKSRRSGSEYEEGEPTWREGKKQQRPAKSVQEAEKERRAAVKLLRRHGRDNLQALNLAQKLTQCRKSKRCGSGACPICQRAYQRRFVLAGEDELTTGKYKVVSVVPNYPAPKEGELA